MYKITVTYLDARGVADEHVIEGSAWLKYDDILADPVMVRNIKRNGLIISRKARTGSIVPPHRIVWISWEDDYA